MSLQARLTISSVLVTAAIVALISAVDLGNEMEQHFESTLERAELLKKVAANLVVQTLERQPQQPLAEALRDPALSGELVDILTASHALLEIAVCDNRNEVLADSSPDRRGIIFPPYPDFRPVVNSSGWLDKIRTLTGDSKYYQLEQALGSGGQTLLYVRVVVYPALIRNDILPVLIKNARIAAASLFGAMIVTLIYSSIAFRPLGRLSHTLDLLARGEYETQEAPAPPAKTADELAIMASKVNLLGQQLRGARYDFTDLRGNFERLLDELEDAVLIFGRDRRLVVASGAVEKFLGRVRADILGMPLAEIFPPNTTLGLILAQAAQTGRANRNRRVPIAGTGEGEGGVSVVLLSVDIMDGLGGAGHQARGAGLLVRLRDPEATRQISRQLQTADRLSAISGITSGVAHEVKNPLNAIMMHLALARMTLDSGTADVGRPVELKLHEVPLDKFLGEIVELAKPQTGAAGIRVSLRQESEGAAIRVDPDLMKQAILNILVNAIEAMPGGGELSVASLVRGDEAEIRIADTGPGIPPGLREKIFRLSSTTEKEGSGIGLAMTFRIVQLHDGAIDFTSQPGKGTTFVLRLPTAA